MLGKNLSIFHNQEQLKNVKKANQIIQEKGEFYGEIWHKRNDGTVFPTFMHNSLVLDEKCDKIGMIGTFIDITEQKETERKLKESEEKYRFLIDNQTDLVCKVNSEGNILFASPSYCKTFGKTEEELLGKKFMPLVHEDDLGLSLKEMEKLYNPPYTTHMEQRALTKDGWRWLCWVDTAVLDSNNNVKEIIAVGRDISERKRAEDELRLHSEVMINLAEGIYLIKVDDGIIVYANPRFEEMFNYNPGEMIGKNVSVVNAPTDKASEEIRDEIMGILLETGEWHGEVYNIKKDGTKFWCHANVSLFDHPEYGKVIVSVHSDITERKLAEAKLKESEQNFQKAYHQVNFYKDLFTHDINNVLNNISIAIKLYTEKVDNHEKISDYLNLANESINRGKTLVSNVRKLSQLEDSEVLLTPIEPLGVLKETIEFIKKSFHTKEINIDVDLKNTPVMIYGNELLSDIFENILINAINHNMNPIIDLIIQVSNEKRGAIKFIKFEFIDNGIGITDERKKEIFIGEYRRDRETKGMGFGLSLVKKIITSYNGFIWVENRIKGDYSQGSNFIILIPEAK